MNYEYFMKMAKGEVPFTRVELDGGRTEGRSKITDDFVKKNEYVGRVKQGCSYAEQYRRKLDNDDGKEEEPPKVLPKRTMATVEDLTSYGSAEDPSLIVNDALLKVYEEYSFQHLPNKNLPIHEFKNAILAQIEGSPVVVLKGPTGCGKSTQVPQYILDDARESQIYCNIIITQPRRIAAMSVAKRVCEERDWVLGTLVGYQIALEKKATKDTRLLYCTAGVLLQQLVSQKSLANYTHIIIDEVHERDHETDFLLIVLKRLMSVQGNRTKLILMSATIQSDKFTHYFSKNIKGHRVAPPVIELPVKQRFVAPVFYLDSLQGKILTVSDVEIDEPKIGNYMYELAATLIKYFPAIDAQDIKTKSFIGAVLIFLPGIHEIDTMYKILQQQSRARASSDEQWMVCPLHSTISFDEQMKVFMQPPKGHRKIILATNIAESSITVPDVKYVIDFCLTKHQVQDNNTFYSALQLAWVSKSQAIQRAGRVGRTMPGRVYRLVPEAMFEDLQDDIVPEILRCPLDVLVLKSKELNMGPPIDILGSAIDPPDLTNIQRTILNLKEMGALTPKVNDEYCEEDGDLTFMGKVMASLPLDTHLSKLIMVGHMLSMLHECVIMACCMSGKNIFCSPFGEQLLAFNNKVAWADDSASDPLTFLSVFKVWSQKTTRGLFSRSGGESEVQWANRYFVQLKSLREVDRLQNEVMQRLDTLGIRENKIDFVKKNEHLHPLLLKLAIAGAFYPNYFVHSSVEEKDAVKMVGGYDPCRTVYFTKFPSNQPVPLYAHSIKQLLSQCGSNVKVHASDGSSKVYVEFGSIHGYNEESDFVDIAVPGRVMKAVYRAIKLRQLNIPMKIPILPYQEANKRAQKIFGDRLNSQLLCWESKSKTASKKASFDPLLCLSHVRVILTFINDPQNFYIQLFYNENSKSVTKNVWLSNAINKKGELVDLDPKLIEKDLLCLAPYTSGGDSTQYYRAKVLRVDNVRAKVFYIDYGNTERLEISLLKGYGPGLLKSGVKDEPPMCYHCRLAEVQPLAYQDGKSGWCQPAIDYFKNYENRVADAQIYSFVGGTLALYIFFGRSPQNPMPKLSIYDSFNHSLVANNYAQLVEEPYLSKTNHEMRVKAIENPELDLSRLTSDDNPNFCSEFDFRSPTLADTNNRTLTLLGPRSPLEMTVSCITRKCLGKSVSVETNSVNSVLLDNNPMDTTTKLMVSASVTQNIQGDRLTLRNTTIMPATRGIVGLLCLIFSPVTELRADEKGTHITGALCGLGCDEYGVSYDQENDIEIAFDCKFDIFDIEIINKIRYWMNKMLFCPLLEDGFECMMTREFKGRIKIIDYLLQLLKKKREPLGLSSYRNTYEWNQIPIDKLKNPMANFDHSNFVFPLIWGIELEELSLEAKIAALTLHKKNLDQYLYNTTSSSANMKYPVTCELCQIHLETLQALEFHVKTALHKTRELDASKACGLVVKETDEINNYTRYR